MRMDIFGGYMKIFFHQLLKQLDISRKGLMIKNRAVSFRFDIIKLLSIGSAEENKDNWDDTSRMEFMFQTIINEITDLKNNKLNNENIIIAKDVKGYSRFIVAFFDNIGEKILLSFKEFCESRMPFIKKIEFAKTPNAVYINTVESYSVEAINKCILFFIHEKGLTEITGRYIVKEA